MLSVFFAALGRVQFNFGAVALKIRSFMLLLWRKFRFFATSKTK
jgi:hypothetical protein